ncbi:MAG: hypothetical protein ABIW80_05755 [Lapillicoccus sp.]
MTHVEQGDAPPLSIARAWGGEGHLVHLAGVAAPVHYVDFGGPSTVGAEAPVVLVHGLGGSHLNWVLLAPLLRERGRLAAP